ncbi:hypothetical protein, partial [Neisseria chenwenguii]|uniref:hypothetical protein n=1 Tax=Neisseria chenwenguii TaxID=1853278 RepID=UPI001F490395
QRQPYPGNYFTKKYKPAVLQTYFVSPQSQPPVKKPGPPEIDRLLTGPIQTAKSVLFIRLKIPFTIAA